MAQTKSPVPSQPPLPYDAPGRPQILILGNGLERSDDSAGSLADAGLSWDALVKSLSVPNHVKLETGDLKNIPFPLQYHLRSTDKDANYPLNASDRRQENRRLAEGIQRLDTVTNPWLRRLPDLGADHVFTTNYSYSLERAFCPDKNMLLPATRRALRFNNGRERTKSGRQRVERAYRLYTGYTARGTDGSPVGLWHIHGECGVPESIILGHDGYGRLLSRIVPVCGDWKKYHDLKPGQPYAFASWPELFLFGDVYILGLGLGISEFDLWWLLRRKQREEKAGGRVYFYSNDTDCRDRDLLLTALGVIINPGGVVRGAGHGEFLTEAMNDAGARIAAQRSQRPASAV